MIATAKIPPRRSLTSSRKGWHPLRVDMQVQHRINLGTEHLLQPRCKGVAVYDGWLVCALDHSRGYSLQETYEDAPHAEFLNLKTDVDLASFIRKCGPLDSLSPNSTVRNVSTSACWSFQRLLKSLVDLLVAFKQSTGPSGGRLRSALGDFLLAEKAWKCAFVNSSELSISTFFSQAFSLPEDPVRWVQQVSLWLIREAVAYCINVSFRFDVRLRATWKDRCPKIEPGFTLVSLRDALKWMIYRDESRQRPLVFCDECGRAFRPESAHTRNFCSLECGHRRTAREWRRRDLRRRKRQRR